ncbi:pyridoxal phosphate-dependent transferase [Rhypophila decipiens]|uniref:Pyridoxal phosphate-dependent transferase n=1 Tax=Rhypophila decipiens TaxID=261697 RepID=A0AAN6Y7Z2_9PEZI|nr:pyridoxal phosphate-dependent transferase [Rhypophila decipiens]
MAIIKVPAAETKYGFHDDYSEGAHPRVIEAMTRTNLIQQNSYGEDDYCNEARQAILSLIGLDPAGAGLGDERPSIPKIYFTPGGTGANLLAIASHLRPHEAIISAEPGHIVGKEGGAIEATGHKVISVPAEAGKLTPSAIHEGYETAVAFAFQPRPKMVFLSNATEIGTVYTRQELEAVARVCKDMGMMLLMDGARLGAALVSEKATAGGRDDQLSLEDIYRLTDVFWIGGTKNGVLLGEAIVIKDEVFGADFPWHMKQRGQLLAKSRVLGIHFSTLLQSQEEGEGDLLFWELARHANAAAKEMSNALVGMGFQLWAETDSNQVFVIFEKDLVEELEEQFNFFVWEKLENGGLVVRLLTSWATDLEQVRRFCRLVRAWKSKGEA